MRYQTPVLAMLALLAIAAAPTEASCHHCLEETVTLTDCASDDPAAADACLAAYIEFHAQHGHDHGEEIVAWLGDSAP